MPLLKTEKSAYKKLTEGLRALTKTKERLRQSRSSEKNRIYAPHMKEYNGQAPLNHSNLVSIVIPAYSPKFFESTLLSALNQDYQNLEIVISDDCPDNSIFTIVDRHGEHSNIPIRYYRNSPKKGWLDNTDHVARLANGEYLKFLNDDDILMRSCVSNMVDVFEKNPNIGIVTSRRLPIGENGELLPENLPTHCPFLKNSRVPGHDLINFLRVSPLNFIGEPSTVMLRTTDVTRIEPDIFCLNRHRIQVIDDLALYTNILLHRDLAYLTIPLSCFRIHRNQRQQQNDIPALYERSLALFNREVDELPLSKKSKQGLVKIYELEPSDLVGETFDLLGAFRKKEVELKAELSPDSVVNQWLLARTLSPVQDRLVSNYLCEKGNNPSFGIFIIDIEGETSKLVQTLKSLSPEELQYKNTKTIVLTTAEHPKTQASDKVHFIDTSGRPYSELLNQSLNDANFDWFMILRPGDTLTKNGLLITALEVIEAPECIAIFGDELHRQSDDSLGLIGRPDFNIDYLLSFPAAMTRHWLFKRSIALELGGFHRNFPEAIEFDLILRMIEAGGFNKIGHVSEPLLICDATKMADNADEKETLLRHLRERGYDRATVNSVLPGRYQIDYGHVSKPLISVVIPTKDQLPMLQRCVDTLIEKTSYQNFEVIIVDNDSETAEARAWLDGLEKMQLEKIKILRYPHPFNYSAINNFAASQAKGDYLLLLNNDTAIIKDDWLDAMLNHAQRPEVGIVGAKLLFPNTKIQHAGVLLGLKGPAEHPFIDEPQDAPGYMQRLEVDQNYSAVTAACMLIRKSTFEEVGGFDEQVFKVSYNDVDLCLKVRDAGYLTVWTPRAIVMHVGNVSQNQTDKTVLERKRKRFQAEKYAMYDKWLPQLASDPAYNKNFSLRGAGFELENTNLSWDPLVWRPLPKVLAHPADLWGCGHYRIIQPFEALKSAGKLNGTNSFELLSPVELERFNPDAVIMQRPVDEQRLTSLEEIKRFSRAFKVYELDDYLPNLPRKSAYRQHMPKDILKSLRQGLGNADRFVVSTHPLAEVFSGFHADIRVVKNRLPTTWWEELCIDKSPNERPRVGWAGGIGHTGDLELVADVVKDLANEVDWIFFGMCPEKLKPYVKEVHNGVDIVTYPQKLASLNLDLAIAPLELNLFNECKSNLRLLEYGACGFPVIATDIRNYREDNLPVTLVKNRYKDWVEAIRMHLSDREASHREGDKLREMVLSHWMLNEAALEEWASAWTPS